MGAKYAKHANDRGKGGKACKRYKQWVEAKGKKCAKGANDGYR